MANPEQLEEQREETRLIIEELLEDGSDPDALYTIEHHLSADDLETLEKAAVEAFKLGYEVTDPEELEVEDGDIVICCDILSECALNADLIDAQVEQLMTLAEKFDVEYDGWALTLKILMAKMATMKILSMKTMMGFATN
ncbi:RNase E inhibitor protein [Escherichia coli]|nr:RNase E inhibitor protein [Escherichia coli]